MKKVKKFVKGGLSQYSSKASSARSVPSDIASDETKASRFQTIAADNPGFSSAHIKKLLADEDRRTQFQAFAQDNPDLPRKALQKVFNQTASGLNDARKITYNEPTNVVNTNLPEEVRKIELQDTKNKGLMRAQLANLPVGSRITGYDPYTGRDLASYDPSSHTRTETYYRVASGAPGTDRGITRETIAKPMSGPSPTESAFRRLNLNPSDFGVKLINPSVLPAVAKKGGAVKKYTKGGKINLSASGVSTAQKSKKSPKW